MAQFIDLTGKRFGRWKVLHIGTRTKGNRITWRCECDCGNIRDVLTHGLLSGKSKSCGCLVVDTMQGEFKDISGERYGKLVVNSDYKMVHRENGKGLLWLCRCDCGNEAWVDGVSLRRGHVKSCGCLHQDQLKKIDRTKISHKKHGATDKHGQCERLYNVWKGMRNRCNNEKSSVYKYYGGRGIKVCPEWENDYAVFREWALKNGYDENAAKGQCTIDRIDNNGNYEPSNCRFVSMAVQNINKRSRGSVMPNPSGRWD